MAGSVNKVTLLGRLGQDPETRDVQNGGKIVTFSVATSESWKDKNTGERKEKTEWHRIVIFNENIGRIAAQYLRKGSLVYLEGELQTRRWSDDSGTDRFSTEVILRPYRGEIKLLGSRQDAGDPEQQQQPEQQAQQQQQQAQQTSSTMPNQHRSEDVLDDDIPF